MKNILLFIIVIVLMSNLSYAQKKPTDKKSGTMKVRKMTTYESKAKLELLKAKADAEAKAKSELERLKKEAEQKAKDELNKKLKF